MDELLAARRVGPHIAENSLALEQSGLADSRRDLGGRSCEQSLIRDLVARRERKKLGRLFKKLIVPDEPPTDRRQWQKNILIR